MRFAPVILGGFSREGSRDCRNLRCQLIGFSTKSISAGPIHGDVRFHLVRDPSELKPLRMTGIQILGGKQMTIGSPFSGRGFHAQI